MFFRNQNLVFFLKLISLHQLSFLTGEAPSNIRHYVKSELAITKSIHLKWRKPNFT
jgi:hypothetical protein